MQLPHMIVQRCDDTAGRSDRGEQLPLALGAAPGEERRGKGVGHRQDDEREGRGGEDDRVVGQRQDDAGAQKLPNLRRVRGEGAGEDSTDCGALRGLQRRSLFAARLMFPGSPKPRAPTLSMAGAWGSPMPAACAADRACLQPPSSVHSLHRDCLLIGPYRPPRALSSRDPPAGRPQPSQSRRSGTAPR